MNNTNTKTITTDKPIEPIGFASILHTWIISIGAAFMLCMFVYNVFIGIVAVNGESMEPTLHDNERIVISRMYGQLCAGDVVVIQLDETSMLGDICIVKRVVATEGQTVHITPDGRVVVDGEIINDGFDYCYDAGCAATEFIVPDGCVFVLGDNRNNSTDSRSLGAIPVEDVFGKEIFHFRLGGLFYASNC